MFALKLGQFGSTFPRFSKFFLIFEYCKSVNARGYKLTSFLFYSITIEILKMLIDLAFLIPNKFISFFHTIWKQFLLKDFVLVGIGLIIEIDDDLSRYFF